MKRMRLTLAFGLLFFVHTCSIAQEKINIKYGKITAADFDLSKKVFDTSVHAVVLADIGTTDCDVNSRSGFSLYYKRHKRIKILNKSAFDEANVTVALYVDGSDEEKLEDLKATTYNLENGKVIETKLESSSVFKEKANSNLIYKKFTLPAVKEGSIIEFSYRINSEFLYSHRPWVFQGEYPCLWSEYETNIPDFYSYVVLSQGYLPFHINKRESTPQHYRVSIDQGSSRSIPINLDGNLITNRWVMKDIPALKREAFTSTIDNYLAKLTFQFAQIHYPNNPPVDIIGNWGTVSEKLMNNESFGLPINRPNNWLDDEMKSITKNATNSLEKARNIYSYVRDNFTCTDDYAMYMTGSNNLRSVFKARSGSVADINLLLVAMLKHETIDAYPVILSTRERGSTNEIYPLMSKFNYVVCEVNIDNSSFYLDASENMLGFGKLDSKCYNGHARVIRTIPAPVYFEPDSLIEKKMTAIFLMNGDKQKVLGSFTSTLGYFESVGIRTKVKEKGMDDFFKKIKTSYPFDVDITEKNIDSLKKFDDPVAVRYAFSTDKPQEDIIYMNPMLTEGYKENPFKSAERFYPVEMPSTFDETYIFTMEVPENYVVDEIPKSAKINFNDGEGYFEYLISKSESQIQLRSRIYLRRATFESEEYQSLRDFFSYVVKKHGEQIVLKKKKP